MMAFRLILALSFVMCTMAVESCSIFRADQDVCSLNGEHLDNSTCVDVNYPPCAVEHSGCDRVCIHTALSCKRWQVTNADQDSIVEKGYSMACLNTSYMAEWDDVVELTCHGQLFSSDPILTVKFRKGI